MTLKFYHFMINVENCLSRCPVPTRLDGILHLPIPSIIRLKPSLQHFILFFVLCVLLEFFIPLYFSNARNHLRKVFGLFFFYLYGRENEGERYANNYYNLQYYLINKQYFTCMYLCLFCSIT
jgi:hypothetical protein